MYRLIWVKGCSALGIKVKYTIIIICNGARGPALPHATSVFPLLQPLKSKGAGSCSDHQKGSGAIAV
jgi:hypothetical protein